MSDEQNIKILAVKLLKGGEKMELSLKESGTIQSDDSKNCKNPVHPDLAKAVQALAVHLAILTDYLDQKDSGNTEALEKFTVTGYSIGGKEDEEGIVITGMRKTKRGKSLSINSPFERIDLSPEARYILMDDLMQKVDKIETEVMAYLFEGKMLQPSLFEPGEETDEDQEGENGKPAKVTKMKIAKEKNQDDVNQEIMDNLRAGKSVYANPDAQARVANDGEDVQPTEKIPGKKRGGTGASKKAGSKKQK
jgi:hypothetical protein